MKTKLEVLYAPQLWELDIHAINCTPVVRYSDACAAIEKLEADLELKEQLRANAVKRCDNLLKQLERMALLCEANGAYGSSTTGRWDGPAIVL